MRTPSIDLDRRVADAATESPASSRPRMRTTGAAPVIAPGSTTTPGALATSRSPMFVIGVVSTFFVDVAERRDRIAQSRRGAARPSPS